MSCAKLSQPVQKTVTTSETGSGKQFEPFTPWMPAIGVDKIRAVIKARAIMTDDTGNMKFKAAIQVAEVRTDKPDDWATIGTSPLTGEGELCTGTIDIATTTASEYFVRFGVTSWVDSPSTKGQADVTLQCSYDACGRVVGGRTVQLETYSATNAYQPVTGWIPLLNVDEVKAAIVLSSQSGNFQTRLARRFADTSTEDPTSAGWAIFTTGDSWITADTEKCTAELSVGGGSAEMWVQFGLAYTNSSGTSLGYGTVSASVAVRKS